MLLRSGYNTEFSCGAEIWSPNFMTPWKPKEFKSEVSRMRKRLAEMGIEYNGEPCLRAEYNEIMEKDVRLELKALNLTPEELYNFTNE